MLQGCSLWLHWAVDTLQTLGLGEKVRIVVSWFQCVTVTGDLYEVEMPRMYTDWMVTFDWLFVDWSGVLLPAECVGSFQQRTLLTALAPLVFIGLVYILSAALSRLRGGSLSAGALSALGPSLLVVFLFAPSVNRKIFQTWDCEPYEFSATEDHRYMRASLGIRCGSTGHTDLFPTSFVLLALW